MRGAPSWSSLSAETGLLVLRQSLNLSEMAPLELATTAASARIIPAQSPVGNLNQAGQILLKSQVAMGVFAPQRLLSSLNTMVIDVSQSVEERNHELVHEFSARRAALRQHLEAQTTVSVGIEVQVDFVDAISLSDPLMPSTDFVDLGPAVLVEGFQLDPD